MSRVRVLVLLVGLLAFVAPGGAAASPPDRAAAEECKSNYAAYGFKSPGQCRAHLAKGGSLVAPAVVSLSQLPECTPSTVCFAASGSGLQPGSVPKLYYTYVFMEDAPVVFGPLFLSPVGADGTFEDTVAEACPQQAEMYDAYVEAVSASGEVVTSNVLDPLCPNTY